MTKSPGQICWLPVQGSDYKELHWRLSPSQSWQHYTVHPERKPDLDLPGASKGMPTAQHLFGRNWQYVSCENILSEKPHPGSYYRHYKGGTYEVWAIARLVDGDKVTEFVIYNPVGAEFKYEQDGRSYLAADTEALQHYSVDVFTSVMTPIFAGSRSAIAWARPLSHWMEPVEIDGKMRDRFSLIHKSG